MISGDALSFYFRLHLPDGWMCDSHPTRCGLSGRASYSDLVDAGWLRGEDARGAVHDLRCDELFARDGKHVKMRENKKCNENVYRLLITVTLSRLAYRPPTKQDED